MLKSTFFIWILSTFSAVSGSVFVADWCSMSRPHRPHLAWPNDFCLFNEEYTHTLLINIFLFLITSTSHIHILEPEDLSDKYWYVKADSLDPRSQRIWKRTCLFVSLKLAFRNLLTSEKVLNKTKIKMLFFFKERFILVFGYLTISPFNILLLARSLNVTQTEICLHRSYIDVTLSEISYFDS